MKGLDLGPKQSTSMGLVGGTLELASPGIAWDEPSQHLHKIVRRTRPRGSSIRLAVREEGRSGFGGSGGRRAQC